MREAEHYEASALACLEEAARAAECTPPSPGKAMYAVARAQVWATLAQAAAAQTTAEETAVIGDAAKDLQWSVQAIQRSLDHPITGGRTW